MSSRTKCLMVPRRLTEAEYSAQKAVVKAAKKERKCNARCLVAKVLEETEKKDDELPLGTIAELANEELQMSLPVANQELSPN